MAEARMKDFPVDLTSMFFKQFTSHGTYLNYLTGVSAYSYWNNTYWDIVGKDVIEAMMHFYDQPYCPKGMNAAFITLIPKNSNPTVVSDFRPISLVVSLQQILSKILANRLKQILHLIISPEQSAFIHDRQILDGPLIINEVLEWAKVKRRGGGDSRRQEITRRRTFRWGDVGLVRTEKQTDGKKGRWEFKDATSYFISNLPHSVRLDEIRDNLKDIGTLVDLFICNRRDKRGFRFGFVRFNRVHDKREIEESLKNKRIGGRILFARIARFGREEEGKAVSKGNRNPIDTTTRKFDKGNGIRNPNVTFAEAVKGVHRQHTTTMNLEQEPAQREESQVGKTKIKTITIQGAEIQETINLLKDKMVGEIKSFNNLACIGNICLGEGLRDNIVKYMGGDWILFNTRNEEEENIIKESKEIMACLKQVRKWDERLEIDHRYVWLKIQGIPIYARNPSSFIEIGRRWGEVIITDPCFESHSDWSTGKICVKSQTLDIINETVEISIRGKNHKVRIQEIEETIFNTPVYKAETKNDETDEDEDDKSLDSDKDWPEEFSGDEDERSSEGSYVSESIFEEDSKVNCHAHVFGSGESAHEMLQERDGAKLGSGEEFKGEVGPSPLVDLDWDRESKQNSPRDCKVKRHGDPSDILRVEEDITPTNTVESETQPSLEGMTEKMKILLARNTPIKEKLKKIEEKENNSEMKREARRLEKRKEIQNSSYEGCVTRSQARRREELEKIGFGLVQGSSSGGNSSVSVSVENRMEEIGEACGMSKAKGRDRSQNYEGKKGAKRGDLKLDWIHSLVREHRLALVRLQETKRKELNDMMIKRLWGGSDFDHEYVGRQGQGGGLLTCWNRNLFAKNHVIFRNDCLIVQGKWVGVETPVCLINVYADQDPNKRFE
ncbi:hypothetical protein LXL04_038460 [Taraxacum kok-saghyz]